MMTELCQALRNWFDRDQEKWHGDFTIENGALVGFSDKLKAGQYFRIIGSALNDGVYKFGASGLLDEVFTGSIWAMAVPPAVIALSSEIDAWKLKNADAISGPYQSESFGGYSYTMKTDASGNVTWQNAFKSQMNYWRKI